MTTPAVFMPYSCRCRGCPAPSDEICAAGADMTNSVMDRVAFDKADLSGVKFHNAVITGATFIGTNLEGASFDDALIGGEDAKRLCAPSPLPASPCLWTIP